MTRKQKKMLIRILIAVVLTVAVYLLPLGKWQLLGFLVPYAVVGYDVLWGAVRNILRGQFLTSSF